MPRRGSRLGRERGGYEPRVLQHFFEEVFFGYEGGAADFQGGIDFGAVLVVFP